MTSERENCGLTSLLPQSCRGRAEAFARHLQNRLSSLGTENGSSNERSWLGSHQKPITLTQPILSTEKDKFVDSSYSPQEELEETEFHKLLNKDDLKPDTNGDCRCPKLKMQENKCTDRHNGMVRHQSTDSDNEVFYDLDDDPPIQLNRLINSESSKSVESETGIDLNSQGTSSSNLSEIFATSQDCTPQASISDDMSTLSLRDDNSILDACSINEESNCEDCVKNRQDHENVRSKRDNDILGVTEGRELNGLRHCGTEDISNLTVTRSELVVECQLTPGNSSIEKEIDKNRSREDLVGSQSSDDSSDIETETKDINGEDVEDPEHEHDFIPRVRRCSSLKSGKTPPGTPGRKKIVRFADVLGLDLADVRTFLDEVPKVPKSAYNDLSDVDLSDNSESNSIGHSKFHGIKVDKILLPQFDQPAGLPNFLDLVRENQVCLENALVEDPVLFLIRGTVRVRNLDFHKSVHIRYSLDSWKTYSDVQALYVNNSCDGFSDKFSFKIYAHTLNVGQKLEFAVRFHCKGCQYWDSNKGRNYCFQCLPTAATSSTVAPITNNFMADWGASFY